MAPPRLTPDELNRATLARQGLLEPLPDGPVASLVARLGALQAQHPDWPAFALATRRPPRARPADLVRARRRRTIVRASLIRMTVHVVAVADAWPMATLLRPIRLGQWRAMFKLDPLASPWGRRIAAGHPAVLAAMSERPLAIHEIEAILRSEVGGLEIPPNRSLWRHFSATVPLVHVPWDGETYGRSRYAPLEQWVGPPDRSVDDPQVAARHVAARYLAAFGPASANDFAAYVGRGRRAALMRQGLAALGERLVALADPDGRVLLDLADAPRPRGDVPAPPRLLARWDSLLLAYGTRDRTRLLPEAHRATVIKRNADVLPTFLVNGRVAGSWFPRRTDDGGATVELRPFARLSRADHAALEEEAHRLLPILQPGAFARYPGSD